MQPVDWILQLHRNKSPEEVRKVVRSFIHEPLAVRALQQDGFVDSDVFAKNTWTLADLAFFSMGSSLCSVDLCQSDWMEIDPSLRSNALKAYELTHQENKMPSNLAEAGLLALALRERRKLTNSWQGLMVELSHGNSQVPNYMHHIWDAPLACLFSMVPDNNEFCQALLPRQTLQPGSTWLTHILLVNPMEEEERLKQFIGLMRKVSLQHQVNWLGDLKLKGEDELVERISQELLETNSGLTKKDLGNRETIPNHLDQTLRDALEVQYRAELFSLAGQLQEAEELFLQVEDVTKSWLSAINVRVASVAVRNGRDETAQHAVAINQSLSSKEVDSEAELVLELGTGYQAHLPFDLKVSNSQNPLMIILRGEEIAKAGDLAAGQLMAMEALEIWLPWFDSDPSRMVCRISPGWKPMLIVNALVNLGLEDQAIQFIQAVIEFAPSRNEMNQVLFTLYQKHGKDKQALEVASIQAGLYPEDINCQRQLALLLNSNHHWDEAYIIWRRVHQIAKTLQPGDLLGLAEASLGVNHPEETIDLSQKVLEEDENHGKANGMLGRALLRTGQPVKAIQPLIKATAICPEETKAWLDLADAYQCLGESPKVLETLRAASLAVVDSAEIYLALGETCIEAGLQAEALVPFRKAAQLKPDSELAAIRLGTILHSLGHLSEAHSVLSEAIARWPENPDLALIFGKVSLAMGDRETAISALETAIQTTHPDVERFIILADALINGFHYGITNPSPDIMPQLERANQVLQSALTWMPEHHLGLILQVEVLLALGEYKSAFEIIHLLYEQKETIEASFHWRIQADLGIAAIFTSQADLAINALQDAILLKPDLIDLHQFLAESFFKAGQKENAIQQARFTLKMAANNEAILLWFADFSILNNEISEAVFAMQTLTQLAPERPDYWLKRSSLEVENGDLEASRQSLNTLLQLEGLQHTHLRTAALTYLRMEDQASAIACLDLAIDQPMEGTTDFLMEMACLNFKLGRMEAALEHCIKAINKVPNDGILRILQADIFCDLEQWQQALTSLDEAVEIWEKGHRTGEIGRWQRLEQTGWVDPAWFESANRLGLINLRKALIYQQLNDPQVAEQHFEFTLQQVENYLPAAYILADLALNNQDLDRAEKILESLEASTPEIIALRLELQGRRGKAVDLEEMLRKAMIDHPRDFRLRILQASILAGKYDWQAANALLDRLLTDFRENKSTSTRWAVTKTDLLANHVTKGDGFRLVKLALNLRRWSDALDLAVYNSKFFKTPTANLQLLQVLVILAEQQKLAGELNITTHAPRERAISTQTRQLFQTASRNVREGTWVDENAAWIQRGNLAFDNCEDNFQALALAAESPADCAALMASLRRKKFTEKAIELASQFPQEPRVLVELSLAQLKEHSKEAQMTAQQLVELNPSDPIHLAVLSLTAGENQDWTIALGALENALEIWPDEAEWHAWAAEIAENVHADRVCQNHWEQAVALQPNRAAYALALGKMYNIHQLFNKAAKILRQATEITANHPEIWMELAKALAGLGEYREALECAGKAAEFLPEDLRPILLSGEIALSMGKLDWAMAYAQEAHKISSQNEDVILFMARVMEKRGKPSESLTMIQRALVNQDQSERLVFEEARLLRKLNGAKAALPVLSRLASGGNPSIQALRLLAQVQADTGDLKGAEKSARQALEADPDDKETNLLLGRLLYKSGQLDQAVIYMKQACGDWEHALEALIELGLVYQARREYPSAIQIFEQAILQAPRDHRPYLAAGTILREAKDYRGSEAMFRRAAELAPSDINIQRQLGAVAALNLVYESQEVKFSYGQH